MSVNSYLTTLSNQAIIRDAEKRSIQKSIGTLSARLNAYFGDHIKTHFIFGSYSRGTILPRIMDGKSDIDYMVVFNDAGYKPQTYLDRLRKFVEFYYSRSEIAQSNPTIALSLNHIRFELVPAVDDWWHGLRIPAKASAYSDWLETDPTDFNDSLVASNKNNDNKIKPLVRLIKYWNAQNDYVYESYELEQMVVGRGYWDVGGLLTPGRLKDYFYKFMGSLSYGWDTAQWRINRIDRAQSIIAEAERWEIAGYDVTAEQTIQRVLPPANT